MLNKNRCQRTRINSGIAIKSKLDVETELIKLSFTYVTENIKDLNDKIRSEQLKENHFLMFYKMIRKYLRAIDFTLPIPHNFFSKLLNSYLSYVDD